MKYLKYGIYGVIAVAVLWSWLGGPSESEPEYEEVVMPTEGLVTVVKEVKAEEFKIDDEYTVPKTEESLIIANYMDETSDTFTLAEARLMQTSGAQGRGGSVVRAAAYGYFGMMMLGRMTGARPNASRYTSASAHNKATSKAGSSLTKTATRTRTVKPGSGKSGFGGKSSRSYGG